jgi:hypothetical protein
MTEATQLKRMADRETDRNMQAMVYFEAVLRLMLSGYTMERVPRTVHAAYKMYYDALQLIE